VRRIILSCICAVGCAWVLSCSDNPISTDTNAGFNLDKLVSFDTSVYYIVRSSGYDQIEPFIRTEKIIGEPFTDRNGNGVYDPGVDLFVFSTDPAKNQDLNHNGKYDGPDSYWTPGVPFDDIDGNGFPREKDDGFLPGAPYCDFNHNGKRDGEPFTSYVCSIEDTLLDSTTSTYQFYFSDSAFAFTSDSLVSYIVSTSPYSPGSHQRANVGTFSRRGDTVSYGGFRLLVGALVVPGSAKDSFPSYGGWTVYTSTTTLNSVYEFFDMADSGLVRCRIEVSDTWDVASMGMEMEYYFSPTRGPIGYTLQRPKLRQDIMYHFGERVATLPIAMTR
jgi:hypothetical protein